ncbi:MAG TPA: hypothetical protein PLP34_09860, partial [Chitinophagaceae bacterium]|nr:hypothetical protein [Chitinophagaceae bacterium]
MELHDMTAKDILKAADVGKAQVILITAYEKYAIEMYKYPVVDYLLKPLLITDLISAVNKAYRTLEKTRIYDISQFQQTAERYIALPEKDHLNITKISEVVRLEAMGNYTQVYTKDGKIIT